MERWRRVKSLDGLSDPAIHELIDEDHVRLAERFLCSQSVESLMNIAADIAHDFNNIIYGITGYVTMAMAEMDRTKQSYSDLEEVIKVTEQAGSYFEKLQKLGRKLYPVFVKEEIGIVMESLERFLSISFPSDMEIEFHHCQVPVQIMIDRGQIERAILNICLNSRDAMRETGRLVVKTDLIVFSTSTGEYYDIVPGEYFRIIVEDDGEGMDRDKLSSLHEPFFTSSPGEWHTGLRLSITSRIIQDHKGNIRVKSNSGKGVVVEILLPVIDVEST